GEACVELERGGGEVGQIHGILRSDGPPRSLPAGGDTRPGEVLLSEADTPISDRRARHAADRLPPAPPISCGYIDPESRRRLRPGWRGVLCRHQRSTWLRRVRKDEWYVDL